MLGVFIACWMISCSPEIRVALRAAIVSNRSEINHLIAEFAQIVGLLAAFASGRESQKTAELVEFLDWLTAHGHDNIKDLIEANHTTTVSVKAFMNLGFQEVNSKLDYISEQAAVLSSRLDGAGALASTYIRNELSMQAMDLLASMEESGAEFFLISRELGQADLSLILSKGPNFRCSESRFFKDDLETMLSLGLLREDYNSKGDPMYFFTRSASALINGSSRNV